MTPMYIIETNRLRLRELTMEDADSMYLLNRDPLVIRHTGDPPFASVEEAANFLRAYDQYKKYGVGRWAVENKISGTVLGWCGLKFHPEDSQYDIGYRFFRKYWNQGYATEAGRSCLDYGHQNLKIPVIIGHAMKANTASIRVFQKLHMQFWKESTLEGEEAVFYRSFSDS